MCLRPVVVFAVEGLAFLRVQLQPLLHVFRGSVFVAVQQLGTAAFMVCLVIRFVWTNVKK